MIEKIISHSVKQTHKIAKDFTIQFLKKRLKIKNALVFILEGELGAGKTEFLKGVAKTLKIKEKINSPTFVIMKGFRLKRKKFVYLWHLDLYRIKKAKEVSLLGLKDLFKNKKNLIFIEWGEKIKHLLPKKHGKIKIQILENNKRELEITIP